MNPLLYVVIILLIIIIGLEYLIVWLMDRHGMSVNRGHTGKKLLASSSKFEKGEKA